MTKDWRRRTADGRQPPDFRPARAGGTESSLWATAYGRQSPDFRPARASGIESSQWVTAHGRVSPDSSSGESEF
jgi:hypothetical protein